MVKRGCEFLVAVALLPGLAAGAIMHPVTLADSPWRGLLRVQTELGTRCTGFLIAPSVAVTAAHCLFVQRTQRYLQPGSVHVLLRYRMGRYAAHARVLRFIVPPQYDPRAQSATAGLDRALLVLDHPVAPVADAMHPARALPPVGTMLQLAGYGQDRDELAVAGAPCRVTGLSTDAQGNSVIAHDCAGTHGTSGAPLMALQSDGAWQVAGVQIAAHIEGVGGLASGFAAPRSAR